MRKSAVIISFPILLLLLVCVVSCKEAKPFRTDTPTSGIAEIVADECFAPIVQEQLDVFEALNKEATIIPTYANERQAFELFMQDSIRVLIAARELTQNEKQIIKERKQTLRSLHYATDAIALIINKENTDSLLSLSDIKKIMTGKIQSWKDLNPKSQLGDIIVTFDSPNSSTVRYIHDSICKGEPLGENLRAATSDSLTTIDLDERTPNKEVIDFVASNPNALGVIGVNWISNPTDSTRLSFLNDIKVVSVSKAETATRKNSYKPFAAYIKLKEYPLIRDLHIMITDPRGGLPAGFVHFAAGENGQRVILKSGLLPANVPTRLIHVKESF